MSLIEAFTSSLPAFSISVSANSAAVLPVMMPLS